VAYPGEREDTKITENVEEQIEKTFGILQNLPDVDRPHVRRSPFIEDLRDRARKGRGAVRREYGARKPMKALRIENLITKKGGVRGLK